MSNVVSLGGGQAAAAQEPQQSVIDALERLLEAARAGEVQHLVACYVGNGGPPSDLYVGSGEPWHVMTLVGSMELCKATMLNSQLGTVEYAPEAGK